MAVTAFATGTQSATVGTEHSLSSVNAAGVYTLHVDTNAMVDGDVLELRVKQKVLTGGTSRVVWMDTFYGAQATDDLIKVSLPLGNELAESDGLIFTLKQTFGTGRSFPWKVLKFA